MLCYLVVIQFASIESAETTDMSYLQPVQLQHILKTKKKTKKKNNEINKNRRMMSQDKHENA